MSAYPFLLLLAPLLQVPVPPSSPAPLDVTNRTPGGREASGESAGIGPNIILIVADDLGVDMVGAYEDDYSQFGHPNPSYPLTTPNIDSLAAQGLRFRNAWVNPNCSSTRAALLTGLHGLRTGIGNALGPPGTQDAGLDTELTTIPKALRELSSNSYQTAALGKWHLANEDQLPATVGTYGFGGQATFLHPLGEHDDWFHLYAGSLLGAVDAPLFFYGQATWNPAIEHTYNSWAKTFSDLPTTIGDDCTSAGNYCTIEAGYATEDTATDAIALIDRWAGGTDPFFLYVAFNAPHSPAEAPLDDLPVYSCSNQANGTTACLVTTEPGPNGSPHNTRCMVEWLDHEIGRVLCALEAQQSAGAIGDTTVIFIGDNGTTGKKQTFSQNNATVAPFDPDRAKGTIYQGGVHVPLIVKSPLITDPGTVRDQLVHAPDLFATVLELANVTDPGTSTDSVSFVPVLMSPAAPSRSYAYTEMFWPNFDPFNPPTCSQIKVHHRAIRDTAGHKLIRRYDRLIYWLPCAQQPCIVEEFYDLENDPFETCNLIEFTRDGGPYEGIYLDLVDQLETVYRAPWLNVFRICEPVTGTETYCTAGTSFNGCKALISAAGLPSATATSGFSLTVNGAEGNKDGLYFWGVNGRQANPWGTSTSYNCVVPPVFRSALLQGTGTANLCDGSFTLDLNTLWCPTGPKPGHNPGAGTVTQAQLWYRDPSNTSNQTTSFSNAIEFCVGP